MLLNDFYKITERTESGDAHVFRITLNPRHSIYKGHFAEQPVVPGVCTLQIIKDCAEMITDTIFIYKYISSCKFLSVVDPNINSLITISISLKSTGGETMLAAEGKYQETDTAFIKVKATLKEIGDE